jgi:hypothetical protein
MLKKTALVRLGNGSHGLRRARVALSLGKYGLNGREQ